MWKSSKLDVGIELVMGNIKVGGRGILFTHKHTYEGTHAVSIHTSKIETFEPESWMPFIKRQTAFKSQ